MHSNRWWPQVDHICNFQDSTNTCNNINSLMRRYSISMRAEDPVPPTDEHEAASIQLVFFGPIAEEIIGVPVETLISTHGSQTAFLPARITSLYGRQFELRISVSPRSLQRQDISYQVDAILGVTNQLIDLPIPKATGSCITHM